MSWDVMIFNLGGTPPPPLDKLRESDCAPLGPAFDVRCRISTLLVGIDWSDPTWGVYAENGYSIEFNVGNDDPIKSIMLHVRGGGDAISAIARFARPLGWSALDCSTSEFLDMENPSQVEWEGFQAFRDKIVKKHRDEGDS
ncbi:MAG TPA: hypothetical protein VGY55_17105 [Pirellulales bacterium]|jgi:hypothetical protein|nr:hypothetical protein [Pirellulales bacterium]